MATIFEQTWWINAATDNAFHRIQFSDGDSLSAEMIVVPNRERRLNGFTMPLLARVSSPKIIFGSLRPKNPLSAQVKALQGLVDRLPAYDHLSYTLPPESDLVLAHDLAGFQAAPAYTFRSHPDQDIMAAMDQKIRYNIRSGGKRIKVVRHGNIDRYIKLSKIFMRTRAFRNNHDYEAVRRVYEASAARNQSLIVSAIDRDAQELASAIILWDNNILYYWLNCRDPALNDYTANSVLIWEAIQVAREQKLKFDIDGYGTRNAGMFLSRFGLSPTTRFTIRHETPRFVLREAQYSYISDFIGMGIRSQLLAARSKLAQRAMPIKGRVGGLMSSAANCVRQLYM